MAMENAIGGLFENQENANQVYQALQKSGFEGEVIHMFVHKPPEKAARAMQVRIQDIAKAVIIGGLIAGTIGGFLGFLVGTGMIPLPSLEPGVVPRGPLFVLLSVIAGIVAGGLTGIILGAASRLFGSREKAEVMAIEIEKWGVLVTVHVDGPQSETRARRVMEEHNALEVGYPYEKWDSTMWVSPNENESSWAENQ